MSRSEILVAMKGLETQMEKQSFEFHQMFHKFMVRVDTKFENLRSEIHGSVSSSSSFTSWLEELSQLSQTSSVEKFQSDFEKLIRKTRGISEQLQISYFITGLKPEIQRELLLLRPQTLMETFARARFYEVQAEIALNISDVCSGGSISVTPSSPQSPVVELKSSALSVLQECEVENPADAIINANINVVEEEESKLASGLMDEAAIQEAHKVFVEMSTPKLSNACVTEMFDSRTLIEAIVYNSNALQNAFGFHVNIDLGKTIVDGLANYCRNHNGAHFLISYNCGSMKVNSGLVEAYSILGEYGISWKVFDKGKCFFRWIHNKGTEAFKSYLWNLMQKTSLEVNMVVYIDDLNFLEHAQCMNVIQALSAPRFNSLLFDVSENEKTSDVMKLTDYGSERDCNIGLSSCKKVLGAQLVVGKPFNSGLIWCQILEKGRDIDLSGCTDLIKHINGGDQYQLDEIVDKFGKINSSNFVVAFWENVTSGASLFVVNYVMVMADCANNLIEKFGHHFYLEDASKGVPRPPPEPPPTYGWVQPSHVKMKEMIRDEVCLGDGIFVGADFVNQNYKLPLNQPYKVLLHRVTSFLRINFDTMPDTPNTAEPDVKGGDSQSFELASSAQVGDKDLVIKYKIPREYLHQSHEIEKLVYLINVPKLVCASKLIEEFKKFGEFKLNGGINGTWKDKGRCNAIAGLVHVAAEHHMIPECLVVQSPCLKSYFHMLNLVAMLCDESSECKMSVVSVNIQGGDDGLLDNSARCF